LLWHACPKRRLHRAVVFVARADTSHNRDCLYGTCHELSHHNISGFILEYLRHVLCEQGGLVFPTITYRRSIKNVLDSKSLLCRATRRLLFVHDKTQTHNSSLSRSGAQVQPSAERVPAPDLVGPARAHAKTLCRSWASCAGDGRKKTYTVAVVASAQTSNRRVHTFLSDEAHSLRRLSVW
jgi:hypothetical protein